MVVVAKLSPPSTDQASADVLALTYRNLILSGMPTSLFGVSEFIVADWSKFTGKYSERGAARKIESFFYRNLARKKTILEIKKTVSSIKKKAIESLGEDISHSAKTEPLHIEFVIPIKHLAVSGEDTPFSDIVIRSLPLTDKLIQEIEHKNVDFSFFVDIANASDSAISSIKMVDNLETISAKTYFNEYLSKAERDMLEKKGFGGKTDKYKMEEEEKDAQKFIKEIGGIPVFVEIDHGDDILPRSSTSYFSKLKLIIDKFFYFIGRYFRNKKNGSDDE